MNTIVVGSSPEFLLFLAAVWALMIGAGMLVRGNTRVPSPRVMCKHLGNITLVLMLMMYFVSGFSGVVETAFVFGIGAYIFLAVAEKRIFPFDFGEK